MRTIWPLASMSAASNPRRDLGTRQIVRPSSRPCHGDHRSCCSQWRCAVFHAEKPADLRDKSLSPTEASFPASALMELLSKPWSFTSVYDFPIRGPRSSVVLTELSENMPLSVVSTRRSGSNGFARDVNTEINMGQRVEKRTEVPLVVDLDGTLIRSRQLARSRCPAFF